MLELLNLHCVPKSDAKVPFLKQLLLRNCVVDFVKICNVYIGKMIIKAAESIFNSDKICRSYSDLNFGVTFFGTQCTKSGDCDALQLQSSRPLFWALIIRPRIHQPTHSITSQSSPEPHCISIPNFNRISQCNRFPLLVSKDIFLCISQS